MIVKEKARFVVTGGQGFIQVCRRESQSAVDPSAGIGKAKVVINRRLALAVNADPIQLKPRSTGEMQSDVASGGDGGCHGHFGMAIGRHDGKTRAGNFKPCGI